LGGILQAQVNVLKEQRMKDVQMTSANTEFFSRTSHGTKSKCIKRRRHLMIPVLSPAFVQLSDVGEFGARRGLWWKEAQF
jgi:hypothetical protein